MLFFRCKHPFSGLQVEKPVETIRKDADFDEHVLTMRCVRCDALVQIRWATCVGGVDAFLQRGKSATS